MKSFLLHACSAATLLASSVLAVEPIRVGYEVALAKGDDQWRANTVVPVEAGQPIQQGLGPYVVSMSVKEDKADHYTLLVRVTGQPGSATENSEFIRKSFPGNHKEQLEFATSESGLSVKGVIFVGPPRSAAK
jgi:hypothetical protein